MPSNLVGSMPSIIIKGAVLSVNVLTPLINRLEASSPGAPTSLKSNQSRHSSYQHVTNIGLLCLYQFFPRNRSDRCCSTFFLLLSVADNNDFLQTLLGFFYFNRKHFIVFYRYCRRDITDITDFQNCIRIYR